MVKVKEVFKVSKNASVLVCELFADEIIKNKIVSNIGHHESFQVEAPKTCFSEPTTRNVVLFGNDDYSKIETIKFI